VAAAVLSGFDFVAVFELQNDDAVRRRHRIAVALVGGFVEAASDIFAAELGDDLLRDRQEVFLVTVIVFDVDHGDDVGQRRCSSMQAVDRAGAESEASC
jgi:hypothetical protein